MSAALSQEQHGTLLVLEKLPVWRGAFSDETFDARVRHEFVVDTDGTVYITAEGKKWLDELQKDKT